jgi:hypothetical protein
VGGRRQERAQGAQGEPACGHQRALVESLARRVQPGGRDRHDRAGPAAGGQFQRDAGADGVAEHVYPVDAQLVQVGGDRVGDRRDRRAVGERGRATVSGQVGGQHSVLRVQARAQRREVVVGATDAVQQEQRLAGSGAVPEELTCHHPRRTPGTSPLTAPAL